LELVSEDKPQVPYSLYIDERGRLWFGSCGPDQGRRTENRPRRASYSAVVGVFLPEDIVGSLRSLFESRRRALYAELDRWED
jgi:hypothetical protein